MLIGEKFWLSDQGQDCPDDWCIWAVFLVCWYHPKVSPGGAGYADPDNPTPAENALVVVYPGATALFTNPLGIWLENPIIYSPVKLQGMGPGGVYPDGTGVMGSILDGRGMGGTEVYAGWWRTLAGDIWLNRGGWDGSPVDVEGNPRRRLFSGGQRTAAADWGHARSGRQSRYRAAITSIHGL